MIKAIKVLILSLALLFSSVPAVTAAHTSFGFDLPHEVAEVLSEWHFDATVTNTAQKAGCDLVVTAAIRTHDKRVAGYVIHAADTKTRTERLVSVELWNIRGEKVYSWQNKADYKALKACHIGTPV